MGEEQKGGVTEDQDEVVGPDPDPQFEPLVTLQPVQTKTLEEDEEELLKLRAKLFRYDTAAEPREWKERGTGEVKILRHRQTNTCRLLMRRDKTLKICANHYILPHFELKPNCGSDRAWVWSAPADFADEEPRDELLAIRFANSDGALEFKKIFDEAKAMMAKKFEQDKGSKLSDVSSVGEQSKSEMGSETESETGCKTKSETGSETEREMSGSMGDKASSSSKETDAAVDNVAADIEKLTMKKGAPSPVDKQ